jgi:hypothetical protein
LIFCRFAKVFDIFHFFAFQRFVNDSQFLSVELQIFQGQYVNFLVAKGNIVHKIHLFKVNALRLIYQPLEMGKRSAAAPKIAVQESSICIAFMAVIFHVGFYVGSTTAPKRNEESRV